MKHIAMHFALALSCSFGVAACSSALIAPSPMLSPRNSSTSVDIKRNVRVVLDLVDENGRVTIYDTFTNDRVGRKGQFPAAIFNDSPADHRYILFDDVKWINNLSGDLRAAMLSKFSSGQWIIGIKGSDMDLKSALGLVSPDLENSTLTSQPGLAVFLYQKPPTAVDPTGRLNELIIAAPTDKNFRSGGPSGTNSLSTAMDLMRDWYQRKSTAVGDSDDPWNAIQNFEWDGTTTGNYNGNEQTVGTYKFTLSPYWLDSDQNGKDWYRVDFQVISEITNYEYTGHSFGDTSGKCGWWTTQMHADAQVLGAGTEWWAFMPDTTVGSTTTGFSIGGDINTSQAGVTGSYSKSYGTSDVTIQVLANSQDQSIDWKASLSGCGGYSKYPDYHGASSAAKSTYVLDPSFIIDVPSGQKMEMTASNSVSAWTLVAEKDHVKCDTVCDEIHDHQYKTTVSPPASVTCTKTGCVIGIE